jgi:MFS family permease
MTGSTSSLSADHGSASSIKRLTLVATILGSSIAILDTSSVSVALPSIQRSLGGGLAEHERGPAIGTWTAWGTIAGAIGPLLAGAILNVASWRWIFVINLPLVIACLWLILKAVPQTLPQGSRRGVDIIGALLGVLGLGGPVFALIEQPRLGWSSPAVSGSLAAGVVLFAAFLVYESRASDPMLRLDLFKSRSFTAGNIETLTLY